MIKKIQKEPQWVNKMTQVEAKDIMDQGHEIIIARKLGTKVPYIMFRCHKRPNGTYFGGETHSGESTQNIESVISQPITEYRGGMVLHGWWGFFSKPRGHAEYSYTTNGELEYFINYKKGYVKPSNGSTLMPLLRDF